jgi:hypothetical protein
MPIPTVASLRRVRRQLDRRCLSADRVMAAMRKGQALHCSFERGGPVWWLSDGARVSPEVAKLVVDHVQTISVGDGLFRGGTAQTYRFTN